MEKKQNFLLSKKIVTEEDYNTLVSNNENNNKNFTTPHQITTEEEINDLEINNNNPMEINDSDNSEIINKNIKKKNNL